MQFLLLGLAALALGLLLIHGFSRANVAALARALRVATGVAALTGAGVLLIRGSASYALPLALFGSWLLWGGGGPWLGGTGQRSPGQVSRVVTEHLELELEHDSGELRGHVRKGVFAGRDIKSLAPAELALLWQDCRFADPQSAQILEALLDRVHPTWREDMARAEAEPGPGGVMTRAEAYEILGLAPGASEEEIRRAHRELILKMHPDRGGSSYLAAKINQAKELLLRR
jgi:hypothetical protein